MTVTIQSRGPQCPKCKRTVIGLIAVNDDGTGKKVCRDCKRKIRSDGK